MVNASSEVRALGPAASMVRTLLNRHPGEGGDVTREKPNVIVFLRRTRPYAIAVRAGKLRKTAKKTLGSIYEEGRTQFLYLPCWDWLCCRPARRARRPNGRPTATAGGHALFAPDSRSRPPTWAGWSAPGPSAAGPPISTIRRSRRRRPAAAVAPPRGVAARFPPAALPGVAQMTPLVAGGLMFLATPYRRVIALDADSGIQIWAIDLPEQRQSLRRAA